MAEPHRQQPTPGPTLELLLENLGRDVLDVLAAPRGLSVPFGRALVHDPGDDLPLGPGDVVLAVGVDAVGPSLIELLDLAADADAAAVIVKARGADTADAANYAERRGITLLDATPSIAWAQLLSLTGQVGAAPSAGTRSGPAVGDLFALANAVASMVGGAVTIEDVQSRVLAYSNLDAPIDAARRETILGRQVPRRWIERLRREGAFARLWSTDEVVPIDVGEVDGEPVLARRAVAVRAGGEFLGSIWVSEGRKPFDDTTDDALREAAGMAALHLVRHQAGHDLHRRIRGELLLGLLEGRGQIAALTEELEVRPDESFAVIGYELPHEDDADVAVLRERVMELVSLHGDAFRRRAAEVPIGRTVYQVLPVTGDDPLPGLRRLAVGLVDRIEDTLGVRVRVGIGGVVDHLREVPRARTEADLVLRVLSGEDLRRVAHIADVRAAAVLLEILDLAGDRDHLRQGKVARLAELDRDKGSEYVPTLRAHLDHFGDVPAAAAHLGVHVNTFRYRLRRLVEVVDLDLTNADERLAAELQLRLLDR